MFESAAANFYRAVMWAGHFVCYQNPARSPHLFGAQLPLCWRCTGISLGALAFLVWLLAKRRLPALWLSVALAVLMPLDVLQAIITRGDGDNARRLITGTLWGFFAASLALHFLTFAAARRRISTDERSRIAASGASVA
ncbi:MAG: putative rane protein [Acidobacteriota bacterium]|jgi:uncharacterized membrane protein|nr:putative rane protein [Acidobacteriota bacterium]